MIESIFRTLLTTVGHSTLLAALVLGVILLLGERLQPRFRYMLWCVVILRLLIPTPPSASWGIFTTHKPTILSSRKNLKHERIFFV